MKLYMRQKVFTWRDRFVVKDEFGTDVYYGEGELFSFVRRLHVFDTRGDEVLSIERKMFSWMPTYFICVGGQCIAKLVKEFTFFRPSFYIEGNGLQIQGDFWAHEYQMMYGNRLVMSLSKEWFTWGDSYMLDILDPADARISLGVALAIDGIMQDADNN